VWLVAILGILLTVVLPMVSILLLTTTASPGPSNSGDDTETTEVTTTFPPDLPGIPPTSSSGNDGPPPESAQAVDVDDCIQVTPDGTFRARGSCAGGDPYRVVRILDGNEGPLSSSDCPSLDHDHIFYDAIGADGVNDMLCLEVNLVESYCYRIPEQGFITSSYPDPCESPGTVHVVEVVPGASDDSGCTTNLQWNRWYAFDTPIMVACVMAY
jgi:hypothetical protein